MIGTGSLLSHMAAYIELKELTDL